MTNSTAVVPVNNSTNTTDTFDFKAFLASDFLEPKTHFYRRDGKSRFLGWDFGRSLIKSG